MNKKLKEIYSTRAKIIKAMAHPTRLFIINELQKGETCVCELVKLVGNDQSTVSKHLSVMKNAGIIEDDKRGLKVFYKLKYRCIFSCLTCIERMVASNSRQLQKVVHL